MILTNFNWLAFLSGERTISLKFEAYFQMKHKLHNRALSLQKRHICACERRKNNFWKMDLPFAINGVYVCLCLIHKGASFQLIKSVWLLYQSICYILQCGKCHCCCITIEIQAGHFFIHQHYQAFKCLPWRTIYPEASHCYFWILQVYAVR